MLVLCRNLATTKKREPAMLPRVFEMSSPTMPSWPRWDTCPAPASRSALRYGLRGLPGQSSLVEHRHVRNPIQLDECT